MVIIDRKGVLPGAILSSASKAGLIEFLNIAKDIAGIRDLLLIPKDPIFRYL